MQTLFSVIIPSYNRAHILPQAITSVLNQTYSNWELILVDDGSKDNTQEVVQGYNDTRIVYIKKENGGVCSARNLGVHSAKGDYIVFLDSDDTVSSNWLFNFLEQIIENSTIDIICGGMQRIESSNQNSVFVKPTDYGKGANGWAVIIPGAFAIKKSFLLMNGLYDEHIAYGENTELFIRFEINNPKVAYTNKFDLVYYPSIDGGSKNIKNQFDFCLYILKHYPAWVNRSSKKQFIFYNVLAVKAKILGQNKIAFHYYVKALKIKPFFLKNYYRLVVLSLTYFKNILKTLK